MAKTKDLFAPGGVRRKKGVDLVTSTGKKRKPKAKKGSSAAALKKKRASKLDRDPLYNPQAQLSGRKLARAALDLTRLEYDPREKALTEEGRDLERQGGAQQSRARTMYTDLATREAKTIAQQKALSAMLSRNLGTIASDTDKAQTAAATEAGKRIDEDTSLRGEGLEGGAKAQLAAETAAQKSRSAGSAQAFRSAGALSSGAYEGLANTTAQARQQRGQEVGEQLSTRLLNALGENRARRRDLSTERSGAKTKNLLTLRQQGFENLATVQGLGLKEAELGAEVADKKANRNLARTRIKETRRHNKAGEDRLSASEERQQRSAEETRRHNLVSEGQGQQRIDKKGSKKGSFTATQKRTNRKDLRKAMGLVRQTGDAKPGRGAKLRGFLGTKGYDPLLSLAATEMVIYRGVTAKTRKRILRAYGITLPLKSTRSSKRNTRSP